MEIDFLGLSGSNTNPVKDDVVGVASIDSTITPPPAATTTSHSQMQRSSFSDKLSKPSWMLSFHPPREHNPPRYRTANGFPLRPLQPLPVVSNHDPRKFPVSTHPGQLLMTTPLIKLQPPVLNSMLLPTTTFPVSHPQIGSPVPRDTGGPTSPGAMTQLTIFFAGSVSVYDHVSPDKAQAILSLARSTSSASPSKPVTVTQVQSQPLRPSLNGVWVGKSPLISPSSSSLVNTQPVNTKQSIMTPPTLVQTVAIPQARKVSLARFLERRKERMINTSPYGSNKRSPERGGVPSDNISCSGVNSAGSIPNSEARHK